MFEAAGLVTWQNPHGKGLAMKPAKGVITMGLI
jgi:hypothetical protein